MANEKEAYGFKLHPKNNFGDGGFYQLGQGYLLNGNRWNRAVTDPKAEYAAGATEVKVNFQPEAVPEVPGWQKVTEAEYSSKRGHGWTQRGLSRKRNKTSSVTEDTLVGFLGDIAENTFTYDMPDGDYVIFLRAGDPSNATRIRLHLQNSKEAAYDGLIEKGTSKVIIRPVTIAEGKLKLTFRRRDFDRGAKVQTPIVRKASEVTEDLLGRQVKTNLAGKKKQRGPAAAWTRGIPMTARAMVKAGETLCVAGSPDEVPEDDSWRYHESRGEGVVRTFSAADGNPNGELALPAAPVYHGLSAAGGNLYVSCVNGNVVRLRESD